MRKVNFSFALYSGMRNLFTYRSRGRSFRRMASAVIGIALSLIPLNVVLVVANGMIEGITERFVELGTNHLQIRRFNLPGDKEINEVEEVLEGMEGLVLHRLTCEGSGLLYSNGKRSGIVVKALPEDILSKDRGFREFLEIREGEFDISSPDSIMLSIEVAEKLGVHPGDEVKLLVSANPGGRGIIIRPSNFILRGVFSTGYYELDSLSAYINIERGLAVFRNPSAVYFGIKVEDPFDGIEEIAGNLRRALPEGWHTYTWYELERPMYETFRTTKNILMFLVVLILIVASVNISSSLVMLVLEKEQDIAVLKSAGASPGTVSASFVITGFLLGLAGTVLGMAVGLLTAVHINEIIVFFESLAGNIGGLFRNVGGSAPKLLNPAFYLEEIPVHIHPAELWIISLFSILCATLASYLPSKRAGRIRPLEIMRKH